MVEKITNRTPLSLAVVLGAIITCLFAIISSGFIGADLREALMVVAGMLMMATLSAISQHIEDYRRAPLLEISFDENINQKFLDGSITSNREVGSSGRDISQEMWEPTPDQLLTDDPTLALAKLRIDIERELRRIAFEHKLKIDRRWASVSFIVSRLQKEEVLDPLLIATIKNILPVCNDAIHGAEVTLQLARAVLNVGASLVAVLRATNIQANQVADNVASTEG